MKEKKITKFGELKKAIDSVKLGEEITRQEIKQFLGIENSWEMSSVDNYRNTFCKAGFLEITKPGYYKKTKNMDMSLTCVGAMQIAETLQADGDLMEKWMKQDPDVRWKDFLTRFRGFIKGTKFGI